VIAFGVWVEDASRFQAHAAPAIASVMEPDSVVFESTTDGCVFEAYDEILEAARELDGLEALVLVRDDVEFADPALLDTVRAAFEDPGVAALGAAGARHVTSLRWWEGETCAPGEEAHLVDDGLVALPPATVAALRFAGSGWRGAHGEAAELCSIVRVNGLRVEVAALGARRTVGAAETAAFTAADHQWRHRWSSL
jgi:hypothetical protein